MRSLVWGAGWDTFEDLVWRETRGWSATLDGSGSNNDQGGITFDDTTDPNTNITLVGSSTRRHYLGIDLTTIATVLGPSPVIVSAEVLIWGEQESTGWGLSLYKMLVAPGLDATFRYRTGSDVWTGDGYGPLGSGNQPGADEPVDCMYYGSTQYVNPQNPAPTYNLAVDVAPPLRDALATNTDMWVLIKTGNGSTIWVYWTRSGQRPYLQVRYLYPLEFYGCLPDGDLDPSQHLTASAPLYLGAHEPGQTGSPVKVALRNWSGRTYDLVRVWEDRAEVTAPVQVAGSGSGTLSHVHIPTQTVSQRYTVVMDSPTEYEVLAEDSGNNPQSLHPALNDDPDWTGNTSTDKVLPSGVTIPADAWSGTPAAGDEYRVVVTGNTTPVEWDTDTEGVEMTYDSGGAPNDTAWRPIHAARTRSTATVTIDSATVVIPIRHTVPAWWHAGRPVWIGDGDNVDEGVLDSVTETSLTITGLDVTNNSYPAGTAVESTLPVGQIAGATWSKSTQDAGAAVSPASRIYLESTVGFAVDQLLTIQDPDTGDQEAATVSAVTSTYLDLEANIINDYTAGSVVTVLTSGVAYLWLRSSSDETSEYGERRIRLTVRV